MMADKRLRSTTPSAEQEAMLERIRKVLADSKAEKVRRPTVVKHA